MRKKIEKMDDFGRGITYVNNKITFIPKCIEGDEVEFIITDEKAKYFLGKLEKIVRHSSLRVKANCPFYNECGGCALQNLSYEDTIKFKINKLTNLFKRNKIEYEDFDVIKNPSPFSYRNKISLKIIGGKIGFFEENTHDIVSINSCLLANPEINKTIKLLPLMNIKNALVTIRTNYQKEILIIIETKESIPNIPSVIAEEINLKGIIFNNKTIYGQNHFIDQINDLKYEISYNSFFQVNPYVASLLFKEIQDSITENDIVFDLYSGVGALSFVEAKKAKRVIGIEVVQNAVINAVKNKELNKIENVDFILRDLSLGVNIQDIPTCLVIDPPRSGIDKKTMNWIINSQISKIIYVSCNPNTLVRDIRLLTNYNVKTIKLFDMFSYTYHCENVCILERMLVDG